LTNPGLSRREFVETLARSFGLSLPAQRSKATLLVELEQTLLDARKSGQITALVVDEAQRLSEELLEEIRLLANIETETEKLLPLVLAGQPELADRLNATNLRQLKQRVALRCEISPFKVTETAAYIAGRIRTAGGDAARLFTREAVTLIHECARGIPRTISVVCDNALLSGFAAERRPVGRDIVEEVARDFDLKRSADTVSELPEEPAEMATGTTPHLEVRPIAVAAAGSPVNGDGPAAEDSREASLIDATAKRRSFFLFGRS
jgi:general secretion pathway protein A